MGKSILVTGGAGFVGGYLCRSLLAEGHSVTAVDDLSNGKKENVPPGVKFICLDISGKDFLDKMAEYDFDAVIHCAAQASNALSFKDPHRDLEVNQVGTLRVLELCVQKGVKRFIFTSSMSVYGQAKTLPTPETEACYPDAYYAVHKLASEHYIRLYGKQHGLDYTIFRLYTTYGHGQNLDNRDQGLLSIYLSYILRKETLVVKGSKDRTRDIVNVDDVIRAILLSLDNPKSYGNIYNLGIGRSIKIEKIVELLTMGLGYKNGEYPVSYLDPTAGDPFDTLADNEAAKKDIGWVPRMSPEEGISLTVEKAGKG
ncbi:MAG: NAD-dependent epimerase/dehydratase family protein [Victivallales bacterium]|jgi:UDP-glucose 4-epimerase